MQFVSLTSLNCDSPTGTDFEFAWANSLSSFIRTLHFLLLNILPASHFCTLLCISIYYFLFCLCLQLSWASCWSLDQLFLLVDLIGLLFTSTADVLVLYLIAPPLNYTLFYNDFVNILKYPKLGRISPKYPIWAGILLLVLMSLIKAGSAWKILIKTNFISLRNPKDPSLGRRSLKYPIWGDLLSFPKPLIGRIGLEYPIRSGLILLAFRSIFTTGAP